MKAEDAVDLIESGGGWLVSPFATAATLSARSSEKFFPAPHLRLISDAIVDGVYGYGPQTIIVSMPPQHGKSQMISRRSTQWFLGNFPDKTVAVAGYGNEFVKDWSRSVRNDIEKNKDLFGFEISADSGAANNWRTTAGGRMWAAGFGGGATGKPAHYMVIDDPVKNAEEAYSTVARDKVWAEFQGTFLGRLAKGAVLVVVMTRWHEEDLAGRLLNGENGDASLVREINLPAVWESDEPFVYPTGEVRVKGEALFPALHPLDHTDLLFKKSKMSDEWWQAQYQQRPRGQTGIGICYFGYKPAIHMKPDLEFDDSIPLFWSLDFNVDYLSSLIGQCKETVTRYSHLTNEKLIEVNVLDEISLMNSDTWTACEEFHQRAKKLTHGKQAKVHLYGDATGGRRDTRSGTNDWAIVRQFFARHQEYILQNHVQSANPGVRERVNAMNAAFKTADGTAHLFVHPRCKQLLEDFKSTTWARDSNGNITSGLDKSDKRRNHTSDALGYMIYTKFSYRGVSGEVAGFAQ